MISLALPAAIGRLLPQWAFGSSATCVRLFSMAANSISVAELAQPETRSDEVSQRLRDATDLVEAVARARGLRAWLSAKEPTRLLQACGRVYCPEPAERRRF